MPPVESQPMPILAAHNLRLVFGTHTVLDGVSLSIEPGERVGIVGRNGTGKTSLLRALAGRSKPDSGDVTLQRGARLGYLAQDPALDPAWRVRQAAERAFDHLNSLRAEIEGIFEHMADAPGDDELNRLLARQADLEKRIEAAGGFATDHRVDATLLGLGFEASQLDLSIGDLSGGQRARVALATLLLEEPDVMLLDEPTNHLDIEGRLWLEGFLAETFRGAVVMISHDRYLLDRVVDRIVEVERGRLIDYPGNYSAFREIRAQRRESMRRAYEKQQTEFRREQAFIRKYKAGQRAKQARGRESRLDRARAESTLERPLELDAFGFRLPPAPRSGEIVAGVRELSKVYPKPDGGRKVLFEGLTLSIARGERWGIVGPNGAGKTTLVRTILGNTEPTAGQVSLGARLSIGYFQQTDELADPERTLIRELQARVIAENPDRPLTEQEARDLAGAFLFSGQDQDKPIGVLSGGERARVRLAALLASAKNVLVLDEPTNHLDIPSAERLEEALGAGAQFEGTMILISHDRALIDATCNHLLVLDGHGGATIYHGTYSQWREHTRTSPDRTDARRKDSQAAGPRAPDRALGTDATAHTTGDRDGQDRAEGDRTPRSRFSWMKPEQLETRIAQLETELSTLDAELADSDVWREVDRANSLTERRDELKGELEALEEEWLRKSV